MLHFKKKIPFLRKYTDGLESEMELIKLYTNESSII